MKPKRDHYYQEKDGMSPTEARAFATLLVWGSFIAIFVLSDQRFVIFLVAAFAAMVSTGFIWSSDSGNESEGKQNKDAQAALHLLELLEEDEIELLKSRLKAKIQTNKPVISDGEHAVIGQEVFIR